MADNDEPLGAAVRAHHFEARGLLVIDDNDVDPTERERESEDAWPPDWIDACPVGEARTSTDRVGSTMVTRHRDRRPLGSPVNLDETWVALDAAEAGGFMGWPPIVGKRVTVGDLVGTVEKVGPLGMLGTWKRTTHFVPVSPARSFRAVIPWGEIISWEE